MKAFFRALLHPVFLTVLALLIVSVLIWWIGPIIIIGRWIPLETELARGIAIGAVVLLVVLRWAFARWRARKASQNLTDGLMKSPTSTPDKAPNPEQQVLNTRFSEAVNSLKGKA